MKDMRGETIMNLATINEMEDGRMKAVSFMWDKVFRACGPQPTNEDDDESMIEQVDADEPIE